MRRWGLWALPAAGVLYIIGVVVRGAFINPTNSNSAQFVSWASGTAIPVAYTFVSLAAVAAIIGYVFLDRELNTSASRVGMLLAVSGAGFLLTLFGLLWFAIPATAASYNAGNHAAVDVIVRAFSDSTPVQVLSGLNILGHIAFAVAVWRMGSLARVGAVAFAVAPILQALVFSYGAEILGQVLFLPGAVLVVMAATSAPRSASA